MTGTISSLEIEKKIQRKFREKNVKFWRQLPGKKKIMETHYTIQVSTVSSGFFFFLVVHLHISKTFGSWINVNVIIYEPEPQVRYNVVGFSLAYLHW